MLVPLLGPISLDQTSAGPRERRSNGAFRQSNRRRDFVVVHSLGLEQQGFSIPIR
ncbi:MAG: hypothetical protein ABIR57_01285 [Aeromicrobium sp.]